MNNVQPVLSMEQISKSFPGVVALDKVDFRVYPHEIVALLGENGAGKSTLMKILTGVYLRKTGAGSSSTARRSIHARRTRHFRLGISVIHQEFNLVSQMMVFENVFLGRESRRKGPSGEWLRGLDKEEMKAHTQALLNDLGANFAPTAVVKDLGVAQQQMVEIAKALSLDARVIVMDEPTATLAPIGRRGAVRSGAAVERQERRLRRLHHASPGRDLPDRRPHRRLARRLQRRRDAGPGGDAGQNHHHDGRPGDGSAVPKA